MHSSNNESQKVYHNASAPGRVESSQINMNMDVRRIKLPPAVFKENVDFLWITLLISTVIIFTICWRIIVAYLKSKVEGRQSLMDQGHLFVFRSAIICVYTYTITTLFYHFFTLPDSMMARILDVLLGGSCYTLLLSITIDIVLQFSIALGTNLADKMVWDEDLMFKIIALICNISSLVISMFSVIKGDRTTPYYTHMDKSEKEESKTMLFRLGFMSVCCALCIVLRLILKFKFLAKDIKRSQILSNLTFIIIFCYFVPFKAINETFSHDVKIYLEDLRNSFGLGMFVVLPLISHTSLRDFALRQSEKINCIECLVSLLRCFHYCTSILFSPMTTRLEPIDKCDFNHV